MVKLVPDDAASAPLYPAIVALGLGRHADGVAARTAQRREGPRGRLRAALLLRAFDISEATVQLAILSLQIALRCLFVSHLVARHEEGHRRPVGPAGAGRLSDGVCNTIDSVR
ncbi:hypothetical protein ACDA63_03250 [Uliginosibacterium sp. sgz301328]|uniref:hypothetical protein n=1 Tax=Uliginosibacterium sp. sgz301328 TaxID=3243764 RepID=UPI00359DB8DB